MPPVYLDIAEFIASPVRTGIQRVVREILAHWPDAVPLIPVEYRADAGGLVTIDRDALRYARRFDRDPHLSDAEVRAQLAARPVGAPVDARGARILVPELFYDAARARWYADGAGGARERAFVVYDFLPWQDPDAFQLRSTAALNPYLRAMMAAERRCFISARVRQDYVDWLRRDIVGDEPAIPLGNDGLRLARGVAAGRVPGDTYLCFGAFDGRKGQHRVLEAFLASRAAAHARLVFVGRVTSGDHPHVRAVLDCRDPRVSVLRDPSDDTLARLVVDARAVFFVSAMEGYGLPATESLFAGVPVVVHAHLASVSNVPADGQVRLDDTEVATIAAAFDRLADDNEAAALRAATAALTLPTWHDYAATLAAWVSASARGRSGSA